MNSGSDRSVNLTKALRMIESAAREGAELVVLPEFFNVEYVWMHHDPSLVRLAEPDDGPSMSAVRETAARLGVWIVATIFEEHSPGHCYDTAMVVTPEGAVSGKHRKVHPAATESLEKIFFRYGSRFETFHIRDWPVGINICYDNEIAESARCTALNGAQLIIAPFATPLQMPLREMLVSRASDNAVFVAACNKVGREGTFDFCGLSMIVDPFGRVLACASGTQEEIVSADVSLDAVLAARRARPLYRDRRPELYGAIVSPTEDLPRG